MERFKSGPHNNPFLVLTNSEKQILECEKQTHTFRKGAFLFRSGQAVDGIYCISKGIVKITQRMGDRFITVRLASRGEWIGHRSVFTSDTYRGSAYCKEPTSAHFVATQTLLDFFRTNKEFAHQMIRLIARDLEHAEKMLWEYQTLNVASRLISLFRVLDRKFGVDHPSGRLLATKLTRVEIAEMVGASQEVISRQLSKWKDEKVLLEEKKQICVSHRLLNRITLGDAEEPPKYYPKKGGEPQLR